MNISIKKSIETIPGGMMVVPLVIGCLLNTFAPKALQIGGFTTGLTQSTPIIAVFFVIVGANMSVKEAPRAIKRGIVLTITKFAVGVVLGLTVAKVFSNNLFGLSALAIIGATTNSSGALYLALCGEYGNSTDEGAYVVTVVNDGPFLTMVAMGTAGLATIPFMSLVACIVPVTIGMILGNLDREMKEYLTAGYEKLIPFIGFALGTGLSLEMLIKGGSAGVLLGLITTCIGGAFTIAADRLTGGSGVAGAAISSSASNAVATPELLAESDPSLAAVATIATPQIAASAITTALLTPLLTSWWAGRLKKKGIDPTLEETLQQASVQHAGG